MQSNFLIFKGRLLTAAQKSSFLLLRKAVTSGTTTSPQSRGSAAQSFQAVHFSRRAASLGRVMASGSRAALASGRGNGARGYKPPSQGPATAPEARTSNGPRGGPAARRFSLPAVLPGALGRRHARAAPLRSPGLRCRRTRWRLPWSWAAGEATGGCRPFIRSLWPSW